MHKVGGRGAWVFSPCCPDAEEYKRQFIHPVWALEASLEGILQLAVKTLDKPIGLQAVRCRVGG